MFSKLISFSWSCAVEAEHDVEAIIADFTNTVTKLEAAAEAKVKESYEHAATALHFEQRADKAGAAAERATKVAAQIKALVS
jgi:uncharacterized protein YqgV (UPF0045/DUF77 family)